jgi:hypothetical protein
MEGMKIHSLSANGTSLASASGYCSFCDQNHSFSGTDCRPIGRKLMEQLANKNCIATNHLLSSDREAFSTTPLFGESRGKMFGVMECLAADGTTLHFKAFSGQYNGHWLVEGWAPPLFDVDAWTQLHATIEPVIKKLGEEAGTYSYDPVMKKRLLRKRTELSRNLMKELHGLYRLTNFHGQIASLTDLIPKNTGIPTGTGDCCAPKLLNFAATHNLIPTGIAEFYWGRTNKSGNRLHRHFYHPCAEKCGLILGFLLCGLNEIDVRQGR